MEVQTPVLVKPGLRGDQDKPASEVGEAKVDGAEKEEERRRGQELEDEGSKEETETDEQFSKRMGERMDERIAKFASSLAELKDWKEKETEEQGEGQPPPKQVRVHENVDRDRIQSEGAASRSSQHSSTMTRLATLPGYDRQRQFLEQRREQQGRQITEEDITRAMAAMAAVEDRQSWDGWRAWRGERHKARPPNPWRVKSRSKARKKK